MRAVNDHLDNIVRPALQNYIEAERALDRANHSKDATTIDAARGEVTRNDGKKYALQWIVQNSYDAWMKVLGLPQKPLWQY